MASTRIPCNLQDECNMSAIDPESPARVRDITGTEVQQLLRKLQVIIPCLQSDLQFGATRDSITNLGFDLQPPMEDMARLANLRSDCRQQSAGQQLPKHVLQEASIIAHLECCGALPKSCVAARSEGGTAEAQGSACFGIEREITCLELGAGTGRLSDSLQRLSDARFNHVLLDRQPFGKGRSSRDGTMRARALARSRARGAGGDGAGCAGVNPTVQRVVADIAQLELTLPAGARPNVGRAMQPRHCSSCIVRVNPNGHTSAGGGSPGRGTVRVRKPDAALTFFSYPRHLVLISKHLCGPACDLAVGALSGASSSAAAAAACPAPLPANASEAASSLQPMPILPPQLPPLVVATCCHYLCVLQSFAGRAMWAALGLGSDDFRIAAAVTQWASMQAKKKGSAVQNRTQAEHAASEVESRVQRSRPLPDLMNVAQRAGAELKRVVKTDTFAPATDSAAFERSFSRDQKVALACVIKVLMDLARAAQLQTLGYSTRLVRYTTCSLENRLLLATS